MYDTSPPLPKITIFSCVTVKEIYIIWRERRSRLLKHMVHVNDLWGINVKSRCISSHTLLSSSFSNTTLHHSKHQLYVYINIYLFKKVFKRVIKNLRVFLISSN